MSLPYYLLQHYVIHSTGMNFFRHTFSISRGRCSSYYLKGAVLTVRRIQIIFRASAISLAGCPMRLGFANLIKVHIIHVGIC